MRGREGGRRKGEGNAILVSVREGSHALIIA